MDFPQDVAIITLSDAKSILPVSVSIPVRAEQAAGSPTTAPPESLLDCFRVYLGVLRSFSVSIGNEEAEMAEKHYVDRRKAKESVQVRLRRLRRRSVWAFPQRLTQTLFSLHNSCAPARGPAPVAPSRSARGPQLCPRARHQRHVAANARPGVQADGALVLQLNHLRQNGDECLNSRRNHAKSMGKVGLRYTCPPC